MNEIERLLKNVKAFTEAGCLDEEMQAIADGNPGLDRLSELNDLMDDELSYFGQ